jgi:hypothetical protein
VPSSLSTGYTRGNRLGEHEPDRESGGQAEGPCALRDVTGSPSTCTAPSSRVPSSSTNETSERMDGALDRLAVHLFLPVRRRNAVSTACPGRSAGVMGPASRARGTCSPACQRVREDGPRTLVPPAALHDSAGKSLKGSQTWVVQVAGRHPSGRVEVDDRPSSDSCPRRSRRATNLLAVVGVTEVGRCRQPRAWSAHGGPPGSDRSSCNMHFTIT